MPRTLSAAFFTFYVFLFFSTTKARAEDNSPARLAIVDVGVADKVPGPFMDLLLVAFNKYPDIDLLERSEIDKLLREQALSLALSNSDVIKAGKLWSTDAFLMLESIKSEKDSFLRFRLVDTRYGFKLLDASLPLPANPEERQRQLEMLAKSAAQKIKNSKIAPENLTMVAVSDFSSEELSPKWDWLSDSLPSGIEHILALHPGILLMERTKTRHLTNERELVAGLPPALRPSALFIDGAYKMQRDKGPDIISVYIRCRKQEKPILETRIEGSANKLGELYQKAVGAIIASIGQKPIASVMNPAVEAEMLRNEAKAYLSMKDPERAFPLAEAALSILPDSIESHVLFVEATNHILSSYLLKMLIAYRNKDIPKDLMNSFLVASLRAFPSAESILLDLSHNPNNSYYVKNYILVDGFLDAQNQWWQKAPKQYPVPDSQELEILQDINHNFWTIYRLEVELGKNRYPNLYPVALATGLQSYIFCSTADQAIAHTLGIVKEISRDIIPTGFSGFNHLLYSLNNPGYSGWLKESSAIETVANLLENLTQSSNENIRLYAEEASFEFYTDHKPDYLKAREHCTKFIDLLKKHNMAIKDTSIQGGYNYFDYYIPIINRKFSLDAKEDASIKAKYFMDIVDFVFQAGLARQNTQFTRLMNGSLLSSIRYIIAQLEKDNLIKEADALVQRSIQEIHTTREEEQLKSIQKQLRIKYPNSLAVLKNTNPHFQALPIFSIKRESPNIHFRRLAINDQIQAIVFADSFQLNDAHFGAIRLSPDAFKPISSQLLPYKIPFKANTSNAYEEYNRNGPAIAFDNDTLYIGFPQGGIAALYKDGRCKIMNEANGLATNNILDLSMLNGKLYAMVGSIYGDSGLMEVNLETGSSAILFSTKSKEVKGEMYGKPVRGIAADPKRNGVWIMSSQNEGTAVDLRNLYLYQPDGQKFRKIDDSTIKVQDSQEFASLRILNDQLLVAGLQDVVKIDTSLEKGARLLSMMFPSLQAKWFKRFEYETYPRRFTPVHEDLIGFNYSELIYFRDGEKDPEYLETYLSYGNSMRPTIRDITLTKKGLLVLTDDTLYLMPDIIEKK
jgi:hypothetical protein